MKNREGRILGFEVLHYQSADPHTGLSVEAIVQPLVSDRIVSE
jgi:hypothetical protein